MTKKNWEQEFLFTLIFSNLHGVKSIHTLIFGLMAFSKLNFNQKLSVAVNRLLAWSRLDIWLLLLAELVELTYIGWFPGRPKKVFTAQVQYLKISKLADTKPFYRNEEFEEKAELCQMTQEVTKARALLTQCGIILMKDASQTSKDLLNVLQEETCRTNPEDYSKNYKKACVGEFGQCWRITVVIQPNIDF